MNTHHPRHHGTEEKEIAALEAQIQQARSATPVMIQLRRQRLQESYHELAAKQRHLALLRTVEKELSECLHGTQESSKEDLCVLNRLLESHGSRINDNDNMGTTPSNQTGFANKVDGGMCDPQLAASSTSPSSNVTTSNSNRNSVAARAAEKLWHPMARLNDTADTSQPLFLSSASVPGGGWEENNRIRSSSLSELPTSDDISAIDLHAEIQRYQYILDSLTFLEGHTKCLRRHSSS